MSEKAFWLKVHEEKLASPDILTGLEERFSFKPVSRKMEDVTDKCVTQNKKIKHNIFLFDFFL